MSVVIRDMKMPTNCHECPLLYVTSICDGFKDCPLIPVPSHGRLIDADALNYTMLYKEKWMSGTGVEAPAVWRKDIEDAPTIIEAEDDDGNR